LSSRKLASHSLLHTYGAFFLVRVVRGTDNMKNPSMNFRY